MASSESDLASFRSLPAKMEASSCSPFRSVASFGEFIADAVSVATRTDGDDSCSTQSQWQHRLMLINSRLGDFQWQHNTRQHNHKTMPSSSNAVCHVTSWTNQIHKSVLIVGYGAMVLCTQWYTKPVINAGSDAELVHATSGCEGDEFDPQNQVLSLLSLF